MHYPLFLNLKGRKVAVFGAGKVATRKVKRLLEMGAKVEVMSREYSEELKQISRKNPSSLKLNPKSSIHSLLRNASLGFVATSDPKFNRKAAAACRRRGIWVNVADRPQDCDFYVPSLVRKNGFQIAISTGGRSPEHAKQLRMRLEKSL